MATTPIFAEILVIGFQGLVLIALGIATVRGDLRTAAQLRDWMPLITVGAFSSAYVLGVLIDRLADTVYKSVGLVRRLPTPAPVGVMRLTVMQGNEGLTRFLEYQRSRLRIARATVVNLAVGLVLTTLYLAIQRPVSAGTAVAVLALVVVLLAAAVVAARRIDAAQLKNLCRAYRLVTPDGPAPASIVAAVCHRVAPTGLEFLLVRTKGGDRWTFPKGHVDEDDDSPGRAAAREAREEAGAVGQARGAPFTCYLYPHGSDDKSDCVAAFLLEVTHTKRPKESGRDPTWCSATEAARRLGLDRSPRHTREHRDVLVAACDELGVPPERTLVSAPQ